MKKEQEIPEGFVVVTRQIVKDNVYEGDEDITVWGEKAEQQLSLPKAERNPHWRNVKFKEVAKKPAPSFHEGGTVPATPEEELLSTNQLDIPKKRTRNV